MIALAVVLLFLAGAAAAVSAAVVVERRPAPVQSCAEARQLAQRIHESAAWHCGCLACRTWRETMRGGLR